MGIIVSTAIHFSNLFIRLGNLFILFVSLYMAANIFIEKIKNDIDTPVKFQILNCALLAWAIFALWSFK